VKGEPDDPRSCIRIHRSFGALISACATYSSTPPPVQNGPGARPAAGLTPAQVSRGFVEAIVQGCAAALEAGKPISEIAGAVIVHDDERPASMKPRNGGTAWAPASAKGIVMIDEAPAACEVSAYGPPVEVTIGMVKEALTAKGYMPAPSVAPGRGFFFANLGKQANGRSLLVQLSGSEPGAAGTLSRFSTLSAKVTAK
jgi:hypothetical protein